MADLVLLGYIARPFGIKGGVLVKLLNDHSASLAVGAKLIIKRNTLAVRTLTVSEARPGGRVYFEDIFDYAMALELKGGEVFINRSLLPAAQEDEFYLIDLLGARVVDLNQVYLGEVIGFFDNNAQCLFEVKTNTGYSASIPMVKPIVQEIDYNRKLIVIDAPLGLLEPFE